MPNYTENLSGPSDNGYWNSTGAWSDNLCRIGNTIGISYNTFFRFTNVTIPRNSEITSASLSIKAVTVAEAHTCNARIKAASSASPMLLGSAAQLETVRTVNGTTATVIWSAVPYKISGETFDPPSLLSIIQEIINRASWEPGDDLVILILDNGSSLNAYRDFKDYDADDENVTLDIHYKATYIEPTSGGIVFGGDPANATKYTLTPEGGIEFGGDAFWFHYDANNGGVSGGAVFAGDGAQYWKYINTPDGALLIGGDPTVGAIYPTEPVSGGIAFGGEAGSISFPPIEVSGGIAFGGDGEPIATLMGDAGIVFGGDALIEFYDANSISCGVSRGVLNFGVRERRFVSAPLIFGVYEGLSTKLTLGISDGTPEPPVNPIGAYLGGGSVLISWGVSPSDFVSYYQIWVSDELAGTYGNFGNDKFPADQTKARNQGLIQNIPPVGGYVYAQIRAVSFSGKFSDWVQVSLGVLSKPRTVMRCTAPTNSDIPAGSRFSVQGPGRLIGFQAVSDIEFIDAE